MPDPLFQKLFDETAQTRWQPVSDLRDRARRRGRRTRLALVAAAAVAVLGASGGIAVAQLDLTPAPGHSPTPVPPSTPSTSPPPTRRPSTPPPATDGPLTDALFLRPDDVGPGYRTASGAGDWSFEFSASALGCRSAARPVRPLESAERALIRGAPQADDRVSESVTLFGTGDATRYLAEVRARVEACEAGGGREISIAARDFAGQEALLVAVDYGGGFTTHHVLVRQGDLVAEFFVKPGLDRPALQGLGRTAAARLCAGTAAC
jgi:hypothetical protein